MAEAVKTPSSLFSLTSGQRKVLKYVVMLLAIYGALLFIKKVIYRV